jgi:hypothetical protein
MTRLPLILLMSAAGLLGRVSAQTPLAAPGRYPAAAQRPGPGNPPLIYEHSGEAGPDETFFLVGENLTTNVTAWGVSASNPDGQEWPLTPQVLTNGYLAATIPERAQDGLFVVKVRNAAGLSKPAVLNLPQPWWCAPDVAAPGDTVRVFGRNLARRPDFARSFLALGGSGRPTLVADVIQTGKYSVTFRVPTNIAAGAWEVRVHAGCGGDAGWSAPVRLRIDDAVNGRPSTSAVSSASRGRVVPVRAGAGGAEIQQALESVAARGGGTVQLPAGTFPFAGTLRIPTNTVLAGAGRDATVLQLIHDPAARFARLSGAGWDQAPGAVHTPGDTIAYQLDVPQPGDWTVWLRYATEMSPWKQSGVSSNMTLAGDATAPVPLENLTNTGSFGSFQWARAATLKMNAGRRQLVWRNVKGGGISLDAFVFALDPAYVPANDPKPTNGPKLLVLQGEDCVRFATKEGNLPGGDHAAVWVSDDHAGLRDLSVFGNPQVNLGIALGAPEPTRWLTRCLVERVRVADIDGKQAENCAVRVRQLDHGSVRDCDLTGRTPLFIAGAKQTAFARNRLVSVTRFGGNAEAAILGRNETIEECVIEDNVMASPPGAGAGGPTARRLIWLSTGHGSITHNWIAGNGVEGPNGPGAEVGAGPARFGGVAGTDQNVGEMILFEGNHRTAYFGPLSGAEERAVTLPRTLPATPDPRLGSVERKQLAHDVAGNETPFWPPDLDDGTDEPPIGEYYVTVFAGRGQGQTRRVVKRDGERLWLDRPWSVTPQAGAVVAVGTAFYQNLIVGNCTPDGMTGIQLWIACIENVISGNSIARQRKPGLFLYANGTTLASSMPRTWNRGLSPLFWNLAEGNRAEECSAGALVTSGDEGNLPIEFPRALGNVLRHNSFIRNRTDGVILTSRATPPGVNDTSPSIVGTIVEFNVVRDAAVAYHSAAGSDAVVFRRNHAYFWYPVNLSTNRPVAFQVDQPGASVVVDQNSIEGTHGTHDGRAIDLRRPEGNRPLPD